MPKIVSTLDVRPIPPRDKHPTIFGLLDGLAAGETLQIVNDHDPAPLHYQLDAIRPGLFTWADGERGPEVWTADITKN